MHCSCFDFEAIAVAIDFEAVTVAIDFEAITVAIDFVVISFHYFVGYCHINPSNLVAKIIGIIAKTVKVTIDLITIEFVAMVIEILN